MASCRQKRKKQPFRTAFIEGVPLLLAELLGAGRADILAFEGSDPVKASAEYAGRLIFAEYDRIFINIDLQRILLLDVKCPAKLDGQYYSAKLVKTTNDSCCSHLFPPYGSMHQNLSKIHIFLDIIQK